MCNSNDTFDENKKILKLVLGLNSKDSKSTRDKANISNSKVTRGCAPLAANRTSADCVQNFTWTLNTIYSTGGLPYWEIQRYEIQFCEWKGLYFD